MQEVMAEELRRRFNEGQYWERAQSGEFEEDVLKENHPSPARSGEPNCTRSQIVAYRLPDGQTVARVHQYLRPNGTIGGRGRPDPKRIFHDGELYAVIEPDPLQELQNRMADLDQEEDG